MILKPLGDRVLVKPAPKEEKTATGLYISSGAQEKPQRGEVIAVGAGKRRFYILIFRGRALSASDRHFLTDAKI